MTLQYLLDTSTVSVPVSKTPNPHILKRVEEHAHESAIAAPVWHELVYGCRRLPAGKRRDAIEHYLHDVVQASFPILPYDEAAATWHGYERADSVLANPHRSERTNRRHRARETTSSWLPSTSRISRASRVCR